LQDIEKEKQAELAVANTELTFQNKEKKNELQNYCCQYRTSLQNEEKEPSS
jgi:hypothetical protein